MTFTKTYKFENKFLKEAYNRLLAEPIKLSTIRKLVLVQELEERKRYILAITDDEHNQFIEFTNDYFNFIYTSLLEKEAKNELH